MIRNLLILLCVASQLSAATYYVRTDGNDSNTGTADSAGGAWLTIGKAASTAAAGDTVNVAAGTYAEHVSLLTSGSSGNRITFQGTRGGGGEWLTIIDPSVELSSSGWVSAGMNGAWKKTSLPFVPGHVQVDGKHLYNANPRTVESGLAWSLMSPAAAATTTHPDLGWNTPLPYWDGVEGLWCYATNYLFIRFRNGESPSTKTIRISNANGQFMNAYVNPGMGFWIKGSYVTVKDFHIRGALNGIGIRGSAAYVVVTSNYVQHGFSGIVAAATDAIASVNNLEISYNVISQDHYMATGSAVNGAWANNHPETWPQVRRYFVQKTIEGNDNGLFGNGTEGGATGLTSTGNNVTIVGNTMTNIAYAGIWQGNDNDPQNYPPTTGLVIASNTVVNSSGSGFSLHNGAGEVKAHDNYFENVTYPWRMQNVNKPNQGGQNWYIYRNRQYLPLGVGLHFYQHMWSGITSASYITIWVYNNSWSGGRFGVLYQSGSSFPDTDALRHNRFFNNIISTETAWAIYDNNYSVGEWSHNVVKGKPSATPSWYLSSNIPVTDYVWPTAYPDFLIDETSVAWESGTNVFGVTGLDSRTMEFDAWDIGAYEYVEPEDPPTTPPVSLSTPNGTTLMEQGPGTQTITLTRSGSTTGDLAVNLTIGGTALPAQHFVALSDVWTLAAGDSSTNITVTAIEDGIYSGGLTITFTIDPAAGYTVAGSAVTLNRIDAQVNPALTTGRDPSGQGRGGRPL